MIYGGELPGSWSRERPLIRCHPPFLFLLPCPLSFRRRISRTLPAEVDQPFDNIITGSTYMRARKIFNRVASCVSPVVSGSSLAGISDQRSPSATAQAPLQPPLATGCFFWIIVTAGRHQLQPMTM